MKSLDELPAILDIMVSKQKETKQKTYVVKYKGKNLIMRSGKSSWRKINHAKAAVINHFNVLICDYKYFPNGKYNDEGKINPINCEGAKERGEEFHKKLFELIEIVELSE
jgi:hypothetical protein